MIQGFSTDEIYDDWASKVCSLLKAILASLRRFRFSPKKIEVGHSSHLVNVCWVFCGVSDMWEYFSISLHQMCGGHFIELGNASF